MADFSTVARPYAKAVFEIAKADGALPAWSSAIAAAARIMADADARGFLSRPGLKPEQRAEFVASIAAGMPEAGVLATRHGSGFLRLLSENDRLGALAAISAQFDALKDAAENRIKVTLVSASELDSRQAAKVSEALERKHGRKVELKLEIDATLLGGAVIRADDMVVDGSLRTRLKRLAETLSD